METSLIPLLRYADAQMYGAKRRRGSNAPAETQPGRPDKALV